MNPICRTSEFRDASEIVPFRNSRYAICGSPARQASKMPAPSIPNGTPKWNRLRCNCFLFVGERRERRRCLRIDGRYYFSPSGPMTNSQARYYLRSQRGSIRSSNCSCGFVATPKRLIFSQKPKRSPIAWSTSGKRHPFPFHHARPSVHRNHSNSEPPRVRQHHKDWRRRRSLAGLRRTIALPPFRPKDRAENFQRTGISQIRGGVRGYLTPQRAGVLPPPVRRTVDPFLAIHMRCFRK